MLSSRNAYVYVVFTVPRCVCAGGEGGFAQAVTLATGQNSALVQPVLTHALTSATAIHLAGGGVKIMGEMQESVPVIKRRF